MCKQWKTFYLTKLGRWVFYYCNKRERSNSNKLTIQIFKPRNVFKPEKRKEKSRYSSCILWPGFTQHHSKLCTIVFSTAVDSSKTSSQWREANICHIRIYHLIAEINCLVYMQMNVLLRSAQKNARFLSSVYSYYIVPTTKCNSKVTDTLLYLYC